MKWRLEMEYKTTELLYKTKSFFLLLLLLLFRSLLCVGLDMTCQCNCFPPPPPRPHPFSLTLSFWKRTWLCLENAFRSIVSIHSIILLLSDSNNVIEKVNCIETSMIIARSLHSIGLWKHGRVFNLHQVKKHGMALWMTIPSLPVVYQICITATYKSQSLCLHPGEGTCEIIK